MLHTNKSFSKKKREELKERRNKELKGPDFIYCSDTCWSCGHDFILEYGEAFTTAMITGCSKCHRSFCD